MTKLRYVTRGADTFDGAQPERCPVCQFPMQNGFQITCEPGVCMYREVPVRYARLSDFVVARPKLKSVA